MIWEYIKYAIRKFTIEFSIQYAKDKRTKTFILENRLKQLEAIANFQFDNDYLKCKNNLEQIYQKKQMELTFGINNERQLQTSSLTIII